MNFQKWELLSSSPGRCRVKQFGNLQSVQLYKGHAEPQVLSMHHLISILKQSFITNTEDTEHKAINGKLHKDNDSSQKGRTEAIYQNSCEV